VTRGLAAVVPRRVLDLAVALAAFALGSALSLGCAALQGATPADRAAGYAAEAKTVGALCKAYHFDRSVGLVPDVPAMAEICK
jgi:hypothetical protein